MSEASPLELITILKEETRPGNSGAGELTRVLARVDGTEHWYVRKHMIGRETTDDYLKKVTHLKEWGFPVVDEVHQLSNKKILVPDLTQDGSRLYGKYEMHLLKQGGRARISRLDDFIQHTLSTEKLEERIDHIVSLADLHDVGLSLDDPFELWLHPDLEWELIMMDLKMVNMSRRRPVDNSKISHRFTSLIEQIQDQLSQNIYLR